MSIRYIAIIFMLVVLSACAERPQRQPEIIELLTSPGVSVPIQVWSAPSSHRLLWLASDKGFPVGMKSLAQQLQHHGLEVWQADILTAEFLPLLPSSIDKVADKNLLALVLQVLEKDDRKLVLMSDGHGAKLIARFAAAWRNQFQDQWPNQIENIILISPILTESTPTPGQEAGYISASSAMGGRHTVFQPQLSPYRWWIERTVAHLKARAQRVTVVPISGVRDRFYFRLDATPREQKITHDFAEQIIRAVNYE